MAVLGDSIAWGQGATRDRHRLGPRLADGLAAQGLEVEIANFARPGARSSSLGEQVTAALGWSPALAVVVIGANDLTHREPVAAALHALASAIRRLRELDVQVVVAPAPDLSAVPHVPVFLREAVRMASASLRAQQSAVVLQEGGHVADCDERASRAFASDPSLFSADRFHPSDAGYAVIADAILPALSTAAQDLGVAG